MKKIMIVEDDQFLRKELINIYQANNFLVDYVEDFTNPVEFIYQKSPDLIILDINLPNISGYDLITQIKDTSILPILVLTSRNTLEDELNSLNLGADEFINKPVSAKRLLARSLKLLKIYDDFKDQIKIKDLSLEISTNKVSYKNSYIILAQTEADILKSLIKAYPKTLSKDELLMGTRNTIYIDENILPVNIARLRKKLKTLGLFNVIENVRSVGYRINAEEIWN